MRRWPWMWGVLLFLTLALALNFGDQSPDSGEADGGGQEGIFSASTGGFADTRSNNNIYFGLERTKKNLSSSNQTLSFNVSMLSNNASNMITGINWSITYCHTERVTNSCDGDDNAEGTALPMNVYIQNASDGGYMDVGNLAPTANAIENTSHFGVSGDYFSFINSSGQINVRFEFLWNGSGRSAFLNDYTNVTILYDAQPVVVLSSPATAVSYSGISSVTVECNASDQVGLVNLTLYHNLSGIFTANQTNSVTSSSNSTQFVLSDVPLGHYGWNCLAEDGVTSSILAAANFTFTIRDNTPPAVTFTAPTIANRTNLSSSATFINVSITELDSSIDACLLEMAGSNSTMTKIGSGGNVSCYLNRTALSDGTQLFRVYANDSAGNLAVSETRLLIVDSTGPSVVFVAPSDPDQIIVVRNNTLVNVTITDLSSISSCLLEINDRNASMERVGGGMNISCQLNWTGMVDGSYAYRVHTNDTFGNKGVSSWRTINISASAPTITFSFPTENDGDIISRSDVLVNVSVSSSGFANIDSCILFFGSASSMIKMGEGTKVACSFNKTGLSEGTYNYMVYANDTTGNMGSSGNRSVVIDMTAPALTFVNPTPANASNLSVSSLTVNITALDSLTPVDSCWMEWNGTNEGMEKSSSGPSVSCSLLKAGLVDGTYYYRVYANDSGNKVAVEVRTLTIDTQAPALAFGSSNPADGWNSSAKAVTLVVEVADQTTTINSCTLEWNGVNESMDKAAPGASTICLVTKADLADGYYTYRMYAADSAGNVKISSLRIITIDTAGVNFWSLTTTPSIADDLDPGALVTVSANLTDNISGVRRAVLQYKLNTSEAYTNITLNYVASSFLWKASFNASTAGGYNLRLRAEDFAGNVNFSQELNLSVQADRTWRVSPAALETVSAAAGAEVSLGILALNNTGDVELTFGLQADYANTTLNETFPLVITAGAARRINVTAIAPKGNSVTFITLVANASPEGEPVEITSTVNLIVSEEAFLAAALTSFPDRVVQGVIGVPLSARVRNIGQKNASSVSFWYTLPEGWVITAGTRNISVGDLSVGESAINNIEVSIPANAATGTEIIKVNATGENETGSYVSVLGHTVSVEVQAPSAVWGAGSGGFSARSAFTESSKAAGGGGTQSSNPAAEAEVQERSELDPVYTAETVEIKVGESQVIPVRVTNTYKNAVWKNVKLDVEGFMKKYVVVSPPLIDFIRSSDSKEFLLKLSVPEYFTKAEYTLTARITAIIVPLNPELAGYTEKKITEIRTLTLKTNLMVREDIQGELSEAQGLVAKLQMEGYTTAKGELLLKKIETAMDNREYDQATLLLGQLDQLLAEAQKTRALLAQLPEKIQRADGRWLPVSKAQELTGLALLAFERGDFSLAWWRAEEAQRQFLQSTHGRINILWVIQNYWWIIILAFIMLMLAWSIIWPRVLGDGGKRSPGFSSEGKWTGGKGRGDPGRKKYKREVSDYWVQLELPEWKRLELHEEKAGIKLPHKKG